MAARKRRSVSEWLEEEMDEPPRRSRSRSRRHDDDGEDDKFGAIASAISMLEERLETSGTGGTRRRRDYDGRDPDLGEVIAQITSQQDALDHQYDGHNVDNIQRLQNQVRDLRGVVEAATYGSAYPGLNHDIHALTQQLNPQAFTGMGDPMQHSFNSSLGQQLQALQQRAGLPQGAQTYLPAPVATGTSVLPIEALRRDVQSLRNSMRNSNETRTLQGLEGEIRALNRKLNEGGVSNAARDISDIKARMDHLNRMIQDSGVTSKNSYLTAQLQHINENIARVQRPVLPERLVEDIRRELADATRKLVPLSIHDAKTLEKNIQFLAERLDSLRARQPDNSRLQSLEEQLGRLTSQLGHTDVFASLERMEKSITELGARTGQTEGGALDPKAMSALRGFQKQIADVKATADASEKRMQQTLHTLQDVIVKVAEKGGTTASLPKTDGSFGQRAGDSAISAAREAAAKAAETEEHSTLDLGDEPASRKLENSFYAASRAQTLKADFRNTATMVDEDYRYSGTNVTPFRRFKRHATQAMLAAAGIVLVVGIYNMLGPIINGEQTAIASISHTTDPVEDTTGLNFAAPAPAEETQVATAEPTVSAQKLNVNLPAMPTTISQRLRAAAQNGDVRAFYEIGSRLVDGTRGVSRDIKLGLDWLQLAANQQHAPALYRIAAVYEKGQGIPRNVQMAVKNYQAAGDLGNRKSLHNLGALYASGIDGDPDFDRAVPLFRKAAELGLVDSQYNLAIIYVNGMGVKQDLVEAYKWLAIAAQNGDGESGKKRDEIGSRFDGKTLVKAKLAAQSFKPQALDAAANEDIIPASAFADDKTAQATPTADLSTIAPPGGKGGSGLSVDLSQAQAH